MRKYFTTFEICKAFDIKYEKLRQWIDRKDITPTIPSDGAGTKALFTIGDIYSILLFEDYVFWLRRAQAKQIVNAYRGLSNFESVDCFYIAHCESGDVVGEVGPKTTLPDNLESAHVACLTGIKRRVAAWLSSIV